MTFWEREVELLKPEFGAYGAWKYSGINCEIMNTGGNVYCVVHYIDINKTAVASAEGGFRIFTDGEHWDDTIEKYDEIVINDYVSQIKAIREETK